MKERTIRILISLMVWGAFLVFLFLFMPFYDMQLIRTPIFFFALFGFLIAYYYFNSIFLVPNFLARKKFVLFALFTLAILFLYIYLSDALVWMNGQQSIYPGRSVNMNEMEQAPNGGDFETPANGEGRMRLELPPPSYNNFWEMFRPGNPRDKFPISTTMTFLLVFMVSTGIRIINSWFKSERQKNMAERERYLAEISALKSQLNPHFLFNTLNSIYYLARKNSDSTPDIVLKLADLMRFVLTETKAEFISLAKEVECIRQYIDLQKLRLTDKTTVTFENEGEIMDQKIAPLLLLPFVENAFKYGVSPRTSSAIAIYLSINKNRLSFIVRNAKVNPASVNESTGTGLRNVRQRLQLSYPGNHALKIQETEKIYAVELKIILS
jgi:two-component system, LytTR family, sensor kinase